jgi:hypothetical protein
MIWMDIATRKSISWQKPAEIWYNEKLKLFRFRDSSAPPGRPAKDQGETSPIHDSLYTWM